MPEAKILRGGREMRISFKPPVTLSALIGNLALPCGGSGYCGKCRVIAKGALSKPTAVEKKKLHADRLSQGIRLACQALALGDVTITLPDETASTKRAAGDVTPGEASGQCFGFAIDVGTTGLCVMLYDLQTGRLAAAKSAPNPQSRYGADILSRIRCAMAGKARALQTTLQHALFDLCAETLLSRRLAPGDVDAAVICGNTAMLYLLFGLDTAELSCAPFTCTHRFGGEFDGSFLPMRRGTQVYVLPCVSAFLGADAVAAAIACALDQPGVHILADLGTNGELLMQCGGQLYGCSCAAGPAFEAVGIHCGMPAVRGAVCAASLVGGHFVYETIENAPPRGICGSGLLDLLACMRRRGDLDADGRLVSGSRMYIEDTPIYIAQEDVRTFQLAKSAVRTGLETLLQTAGNRPVDTLALAGSFGTSLRPKSAAALGLIPPQLLSAASGVGNAAAKGAAMALLDRSVRRTAQAIAQRIETLPLAEREDFQENLCRFTALE